MEARPMVRDDQGGSERFGEDEELRFIIDGKVFHASRRSIKARLAGVRPESITKHYVVVDGRAYPVKQVFSYGFELPRMTFTSQRALAALVRLGFEVGEGDETTGFTVGVGTGGPDGDSSTQPGESGDRYVANTFTPDGERWQIAFNRDAGGRYTFGHVEQYRGTQSNGW